MLVEVPFRSAREGGLTMQVSFEDEGLRITPWPFPKGDDFFLDPERLTWRGAYGGFMEWLSNDGMSAPHNIIYPFRGLWFQWRHGVLTAEEAEVALRALFQWIEDVNATEPRELTRALRKW